MAEPAKETILAKLTSAAERFISLSIILLAIVFAVRLYETFALGLFFKIPGQVIKYEAFGLVLDLYIFLKIISTLIIPYAILYLIKPKIACLFFQVVVFLMVFVQIILVNYFAYSLIPLGSELFEQQFTVLWQSFLLSGKFSVLTIIPALLIASAAIVAFIYMKPFRIPEPIFYAFYLFIAFTIFLEDYSVPNPDKYRSAYNSYISSNKLGYFMGDNYHNLNRDVFNKRVIDESAIIERSTLYPSKENYVYEIPSSDYPFTRVDNTTDRLGEYFYRQSSPPNLVFVIIDELGRSYSGPNAKYGSFTPFLDSLSNEGLYWENFLSSGARSFTTLPSIFGSIPFGVSGILDEQAKVPNHFSLISLLKTQGYKTTFFYGEDAQANSMRKYLLCQKIDAISDKSFLDKFDSYSGIRNRRKLSVYTDDELFNRVIDRTLTMGNSPRLDIIVTNSIKTARILPGKERFASLFDSIAKPQITDPIHQSLYRYFRSQFLATLVADNAIRNFVNQYSNVPDFMNTIFIFCGDNQMAELPTEERLAPFHVPLLIYSPLIAHAQKFKAVSSQFDIAPSFVAFLSNNYGMRFPYYSQWVGYGLDTEPQFRSERLVPMLRRKGVFVDLLDGNDFISANKTYQINPDLSLVLSNNDSIQDKMTRKIWNYRNIMLNALSAQKLLPDTLYKNPRLSDFNGSTEESITSVDNGTVPMPISHNTIAESPETTTTIESSTSTNNIPTRIETPIAVTQAIKEPDSIPVAKKLDETSISNKDLESGEQKQYYIRIPEMPKYYNLPTLQPVSHQNLKALESDTVPQMVKVEQENRLQQINYNFRVPKLEIYYHLSTLQQPSGSIKANADTITKQVDSFIASDTIAPQKAANTAPIAAEKTEVTVAKSIPQTKTTTIDAESKSSGAYCIVASAFSNVDNADKLEKLIQGLGFQTSRQNINELHYVIIGGYATKEEAELQLTLYKEKSGKKAWIRKN